jgi:hypothetical protein
VHDEDSGMRAGQIDDAHTLLVYAKKFGLYEGGGRSYKLTIGDESYSFGKADECIQELRSDQDMYFSLRDELIRSQAVAMGMPEEFIKSIRSYY